MRLWATAVYLSEPRAALWRRDTANMGSASAPARDLNLITGLKIRSCRDSFIRFLHIVTHSIEIDVFVRYFASCVMRRHERRKTARQGCRLITRGRLSRFKLQA